MAILLLLLLPSSLVATQIGLAASLAGSPPLLGPLSNFLALTEHQAPKGPSLPEFYQPPSNFYQDSESTGSEEPYVPSQPWVDPEPYISPDSYISSPHPPEEVRASDYSGQVDYFYGEQDPVYDRQQKEFSQDGSELTANFEFEGPHPYHHIIIKDIRFTDAKYKISLI